MNYGRFAILDVNHSIVKQIQSDLVPFRDLRYYLQPSEVEAIDEANRVFSKRKQDDFKIVEHDIIGWALKVDEKLRKLPSKSKSTQSQASALLWVPKARIGGEDIGRISRTFLELAMFVRLDSGSWKKKTRYTTSNKGVEPFAAKKVTDNLQEVFLKHYKKTDIETDFVVPTGLLKEIIQKEADTAEHLDRESLIHAQLLTESGEFTELARTLVNVIERWWLVETLISHPDDLNYIAPQIPLESLLYAFGESSNSVHLSEISNYSKFKDADLIHEIMRALSHYPDISLKLSNDESEVESTQSSAGLIWCDSKTLVQKLADTPLWVWLEPVNFERTIVKREVSLLSLRSDVINEFTSKIVSKEVNSLLIEAPTGWGKTGALLLIAASLEKKGLPIALYQGGASRARIPKETVVFVDDVHKLSLSSLDFLAKLKEDGYQIVMTLSQEHEFLLSEKIARLKRDGVMFDYIPARLHRLDVKDTLCLIKENFPDLSSDDYERLLNKVEPLSNSPEAIAFLSMQWELINRGSISLLNPSVYSIFKTPPLLLDILLRGSSSNLEVDSELTALIIINKLGGEILSTHEKHVSKMAKEISKSRRFPRYFKSFLEPINLPDYTRIILNQGIRRLLSLSRSSEKFHTIATELYRNNSISKYDLELTKDLLDSIERVENRCTGIVEQFLGRILIKQKKIKKLELIPYVVHIGKSEISSSFIEKHYGWLKKVKGYDLQKNLISPLFLSSIMEDLATIIDHPNYIQLDDCVLEIFEIFRDMWKRKVAILQDEFNASYLELLSAIARKKMQSGKYQEALSLFEEGINLAAKVRHLTSQDRLLCDKIQLLRSLSPAFCPTIRRTVSDALDVVRSIETLDTRPFEVIVRNQEALAMLHCGDFETSMVAAKQAENLILDYQIDPPDIRRISPLELTKSLAWSHIEQGFCEYENENYSEARAHLRYAAKNLRETRHEIEIPQILGYLPAVYLREGKVSEADDLVAKISTMVFPLRSWILSGSSVAYYYFLFENADINRTEEAEKLRQISREFYPYDEFPTFLRWFDSLRRIIYHRKKKKYEKAESLAFEFMEWLISDSESKQFVAIEYLRTILTFVLREIGICYFEQSEFRKSAVMLLGSLIYWIPICGSQRHHARNLLLECISNSSSNHANFSGWQVGLDSDNLLVIELKSEKLALSEYEEHFWIGLSQILETKDSK